MCTKLWTSVSCYPLQHHGTVMYEIDGKKKRWTECYLQLIKSELILSYDEKSSSDRNTNSLVISTSPSSSPSTLVKLRLWNSSENMSRGSSMNVVAVSTSPPSLSSSKSSFCFHTEESLPLEESSPEELMANASFE